MRKKNWENEGMEKKEMKMGRKKKKTMSELTNERKKKDRSKKIWKKNTGN